MSGVDGTSTITVETGVEVTPTLTRTFEPTPTGPAAYSYSTGPVATQQPSVGEAFTYLVGSVGDGNTAAFFLQLFLVTYMYARVANGTPYWNVILIIAIAGFLANALDNIQNTILFHSPTNNSWVWVLSPIGEPCWIISEFGIIFLNMIKFQALLQRRTFLRFLVVESVLFLLFVIFRFRIGIMRWQQQQRGSIEIWNAHTPAFAIVSFGSLICSIGILYIIQKQRREQQQHLPSPPSEPSFLKSIQKSSLCLLFIVDVVTVLLTITVSLPSQTLQRLFQPFLLLKSSFALILAVDCMVVKETLRRRREGGTYPGGTKPSQLQLGQGGNHNGSPMLSSKKPSTGTMLFGKVTVNNTQDVLPVDDVARRVSASSTLVVEVVTNSEISADVNVVGAREQYDAKGTDDLERGVLP